MTKVTVQRFSRNSIESMRYLLEVIEHNQSAMQLGYKADTPTMIRLFESITERNLFLDYVYTVEMKNLVRNDDFFARFYYFDREFKRVQNNPELIEAILKILRSELSFSTRLNRIWSAFKEKMLN